MAIYSWPFLLDVIGMGWNLAMPTGRHHSASTRDEYLAASQQVVDRGLHPMAVS